MTTCPSCGAKNEDIAVADQAEGMVVFTCLICDEVWEQDTDEDDDSQELEGAREEGDLE